MKDGMNSTVAPGGVEIGEMEDLYCPLCGAKIIRQTDFFLEGGDPELGRCPNCEPEEWLTVGRYVTYLQFLEYRYDALLEKAGLELVEGYGLEGDWDAMTEEEKIAAFEDAIGYLEDYLQEVE